MHAFLNYFNGFWRENDVTGLTEKFKKSTNGSVKWVILKERDPMPRPPPPPPRQVFFSCFLEDKTSSPDVFSTRSFIPPTHFETSSVMVSCYGYEI